MSVSGLVSLAAGEYMSLWVYAHEDASYVIGSQTGLSCAEMQTESGFAAAMASDYAVSSAGW
eukprot:COSAG05_NODE_19721_length_288_cov_1.465608_1_plen_61_part_10